MLSDLLDINNIFIKFQICKEKLVKKFSFVNIKLVILYYLGLDFFFPCKHAVLQVFTTEAHMNFCSAKSMPGIGFVQHNLGWE